MKIVALVRSPRTAPGSDEPLPGLSPGDRAAVATAIHICREGDEVVALTAGSREDELALSAALSMGAHRAVRITDPLAKDTNQRTTATIIAAGLREEGFDLILTGQRSVDWGTGGTGPAVAHVLGLPHLTSVTRVARCSETTNALLLVHRNRTRLHEMVGKPPLLVTVLEGPALRPPTGRPTANITRTSLAELTLPYRRRHDHGSLEIRPAVAAAEMLDGVDALLDLINRWR